MAENEDDLPTLPEGDAQPSRAPQTPQPLFRIFEGSRIAVGKATGPMWKRKLDAALAAYEHIYSIWELCFKYYNNDQTRSLDTPLGVFKRGDATENVVFSNLNIILPAVYSKDPDVSCSTVDETDEAFCESLEALLNTLLRRKDGMNAKPKVKKATGVGLLTNCGILKLLFTEKDDSKEYALAEMQRISDELSEVKKQEEIDRLYGELEALEQNMEVLQPSGFGLGNTLPHNLIVDPYAEQADGLDGWWMMERVFISTASLTARYTKRSDEEDPEADEASRVLVYQPTHKAQFTPGGQGSRDDGLGVVLQAIDRAGNTPTSHTDDERTAYINMYYTECYLVWDRTMKRVLLFHRDDWTWPLWVWDDPLKISRFFPYFLLAFVMSTGGTVSVGETAYLLDQQDELNDINRQRARIRRTIFDFFFYNSDVVDKDEVEKFINSLRGVSQSGQHIVGIKAGEREISKMIEAVAPPSEKYEQYFDKAPVLEAVNRISNTSDALRGVQFKTNTNVPAVKSYEQSMRISVGAKVDVVEDVVADVAIATAEIAVQKLTPEDVEALIGPKLAEGWRQMDLATFRSTYNVTVVAGSMEKPTSAFKKQEAVEVAQAIGQFAQAAPGTTLKLMLRVLEKAFTEVVIKPEDWDALEAEIMANLQRGNSTGVNSASGGGAGSSEGSGGVPPEIREELVEMARNGASQEQLVARLQELIGAQDGTQEQSTNRRH